MGDYIVLASIGHDQVIHQLVHLTDPPHPPTHLATFNNEALK